MNKFSELIWQDKQHQMLFDLITEIEKGDSDIVIFNHLAHYIESHFSIEEEYMRRLKYPKRDIHTNAHNKFRNDLNSIIDSIKTSDAGTSEELAEFLRNWLKAHIFGIDKELEDFILQSGSM